MERVTFQQLANASEGTLGDGLSADRTFHQVSTDSRTCRAGQLFWAIPGDRFDGHDFVHDALQNGAVAAVVERNCGDPSQCLHVTDTRAALTAFAQWYRTSLDALFVGVTGSVGKTTTRRMIHQVLSAEYTGAQSPRNFNNALGVPLSILEVEAADSFAVLEMGASARHEIADLQTLARAEIGVITAIAPAHLEGFGSLAGVAAAKGELLDKLPPNGLAILNADDKAVVSLACRAPGAVRWFGTCDDCDLQATDVESRFDTLSFSADGQRYELPVGGRHHLVSALAAITIGREVGLSPRQMQEALAEYQPAQGRCLSGQIGDWLVVDDSYNASPTSSRAAVEFLSDCQEASQRVFVTGDMRELGFRAAAYHRELGQQLAGSSVDLVIAVGEYADVVVRAAIDAGMPRHRLASFATVGALYPVLDCWLEPGSAILVKGSRSLGLERVVEWIHRHAVMPPLVRRAAA